MFVSFVSQLLTYGHTGKKRGVHSQDYTLYKFLQLLLCVLQEEFIKVYIFILEVTAVHVSHYNFKEK